MARRPIDRDSQSKKKKLKTVYSPASSVVSFFESFMNEHVTGRHYGYENAVGWAREVGVDEIERGTKKKMGQKNFFKFLYTCAYFDRKTLISGQTDVFCSTSTDWQH